MINILHYIYFLLKSKRNFNNYCVLNPNSDLIIFYSHFDETLCFTFNFDYHPSPKLLHFPYQRLLFYHWLLVYYC